MSLLEQLVNLNDRLFSDHQAILLDALTQQWQQTKPLVGISILHNIPLTLETLLKLESLIAAGADLTVTHTIAPGLAPKQEAIDALQSLGIPVIIEHDKIAGSFDIGLDCAAQIPNMKEVTIRLGNVELTQSGTQRYQQITVPYPVISVDDSHLKNLENMFGTGEACVRAIKFHTKMDLSNKKFMVIGFGKVGKGIVRSLQHETDNIVIVEKGHSRFNDKAKQRFVCLTSDDGQAIKEQAKDAFCIVMATGQANVLSQILQQDDCPQAILANMGAEDEIGPNFNDENTLCNRGPINFSLDHPTLMEYIDPIFYAHNLSAQLLLEGDFDKCYHPFPTDWDQKILSMWQDEYKQSVAEIYE